MNIWFIAFRIAFRISHSCNLTWCKACRCGLPNTCLSLQVQYRSQCVDVERQVVWDVVVAFLPVVSIHVIVQSTKPGRTLSNIPVPDLDHVQQTLVKAWAFSKCYHELVMVWKDIYNDKTLMRVWVSSEWPLEIVVFRSLSNTRSSVVACMVVRGAAGEAGP